MQKSAPAGSDMHWKDRAAEQRQTLWHWTEDPD